MLKIIIKSFCFMMFNALYVNTIKKSLNSNVKVLNKKNLVLFISTVLIAQLSYTVDYSIQSVIIRFMANIIAFKLIFDESIYKITILLALIMIVNIIGDVINTSIMLNFVSIKALRDNPLIMIISNMLAIFYTYLLINIRPVMKKFKTISSGLNDSNTISLITICTAIFILAISMLYNLGDINKLNMSYFINVLIIITFIIVLIIFFIDNNKYTELLKEYDALFEYIRTFEESIDKLNMSDHEYKNELAVLKDCIESNKKKKSLQIIDDIIVQAKKQDSSILKSIKNLPKGGIKGLLYYKIMTATNKKLNIGLDISKTIKGKLSNLKLEELKLICNLLGIYLDNAIEASAESKKKLIGIETYAMGNKVYFVISNTFKNKEIDLEKVNKNGYTTKGKGHGRGLYLAKKLVTKTKWLEAETEIFNKMYIQKLIIDKGLLDQNKKLSLDAQNKK